MSDDAGDPLHREILAGLAEIIAPGTDRMPSARSLGLESEPVDRVLRARPDLAAPLRAILDRSVGQDPATVLTRLQKEAPSDLSVLMQVVAGAYYMDPRVRRALNYPGQEALPLDRGGFGGEDLLEAMMVQPPRYRS